MFRIPEIKIVPIPGLLKVYRKTHLRLQCLELRYLAIDIKKTDVNNAP
jgi:hypothetical protein